MRLLHLTTLLALLALVRGSTRVRLSAARDAHESDAAERERVVGLDELPAALLELVDRLAGEDQGAHAEETRDAPDPGEEEGPIAQGDGGDGGDGADPDGLGALRGGAARQGPISGGGGGGRQTVIPTGRATMTPSMFTLVAPPWMHG